MTSIPTLAVEDSTRRIAERLVKASKGRLQQIAMRALTDEQTILSLDNVRHALVVEDGDTVTVDWEGLTGKVYTVGLDEQQRLFLELVMSIAGVQQVSLAGVEDLDERRLLIVQRALLALAGNDRIAIGTRL
jgi:hypothetical protein